ncbi:MAG: hypothetical protein CL868_07010 [Cytophagaceae bacterium]|nr:hypothetical protein [Cytophagaceae bacterium]|tara:strand:- start:33809 stop:34210 length:402 start_codon:yes stop_codon:yes gene_type:complete
MKKDRAIGIDPGNKQNRISEGSKIVGDISSNDGFRLDGEIEGNLTVKGRVVIGKSGVVKGTLTCPDADVEGKIMGKLEVSGILTLKSSAVIEGEVKTQKLSVDPGAVFNATCEMGKTVMNKTMDEGEKAKKPA